MLFVHPKVDVRLRSLRRRRPWRWDAGRTVVVSLVLALSVLASMGALYWLVALAPFAAVGAILILRRPTDPIGWLLLGFICAASLAFALIDATAAEFATSSASLWATARAVVAAPVAAPAIFMLLLALTVVLPAGEFPPGAWGRRARISLVLIRAVILVQAFGPTLTGLRLVGSDTQTSVANPLAIAPGAAAWGPVVTGSWTVILVPLMAGAVSMLVGTRRSTGIERLQFRWIVYALAVVTGAVVLVPISMGIAILRYRLYEIDRIISRTLSYAVVTAILGAVFVGVILLMQTVLTSLTGGQTVAVAASTLAVFALFQSVRRRVQTTVDRRFDRARYDAERTATAFSSRLRDVMDMATVTTELRRTVASTMASAALGVWLRPRDGSR